MIKLVSTQLAGDQNYLNLQSCTCGYFLNLFISQK